MDKKERGVEETSRKYASYDQVDKRQEYFLAEQEQEDFDEAFEIRTCDFALARSERPEDRASFATELVDALREIGFAVLVNTGVDPGLYDEAEARITDLFTAVDLDRKMEFRAERHGSVKQGYFPIQETSDIHPDLEHRPVWIPRASAAQARHLRPRMPRKDHSPSVAHPGPHRSAPERRIHRPCKPFAALLEGWVFCRRAFDLPGGQSTGTAGLWPREGDEAFFRRVVAAHEPLILKLMQAMLQGLGCDPHLYDERLTETNVGLRLNYYPPLAPGANARAGRLLGHEDVDLFTLLPAPSVEGLQVLNRENGKWVRLSAPRGAMILNTGDYMQRISNDLLPSTMHRVGRPRDARLHDRPRTSIPMAIYLWEDELLEVLPGLGEPEYEPIKAIRFHTASTSKFYGDDYAVDD